MKRWITKTVSLLLGAALAVSAMSMGFVGCGAREAQFEEAQAAPVSYSSDGVYATTLTRADGAFSGIGARDVAVKYSNPAEDGDEMKDAAVLSVAVRSDGTLRLTFEDRDAAQNKTQWYGVIVLPCNVTALVEVEFPAQHIRCDREFVLAEERTTELTLSLEDGAYAPDLTADAITLSGAFETMTVERVSASDKTLTLQLAGEIAFHADSNAYLDGVICLAADAVRDNVVPIEVRVPVRTKSAYFDAGGMRWENGRVSVPLVLLGVADPSALRPSDIVFAAESGVQCAAVSPESENEALVVLRVPGAVDASSAAAKLDGVAVTVKGHAAVAGFSAASFYPLFDYVREAGDALEFTVKLYARGGTFAPQFDASKIGFGGAFAGAEIADLRRLGEDEAELIFTVPANGQTADTLDSDGEIVLAGASLVNAWGEEKTKESAYLRHYSPDSLGRAPAFGESFAEALSAMADVGEQVSTVVGGAESAYRAIGWVLGFAGISLQENENSEVVSLIGEVKSQLSRIEQQLEAQNQVLNELLQNDYRDNLGEFNLVLAALEQACNRADRYLQTVVPACTPPTGAAEEDWQAYAAQLTARLRAYGEYGETMREIDAGFKRIVTYMGSTDSLVNPLLLMDKLCTLVYNFDTSSINERLYFRNRIQNAMQRAMFHCMLYFVYGNEAAVDRVYEQSLKEGYRDSMETMSACRVRVPMSMPMYDDWEYNWDASQSEKIRVEISELMVTPDADTGRLAYCYVLDRWVDLDFLRGHGESEYKESRSRTSVQYYAFSADARKAFLGRMQGRTMREELLLAGFGGDNIRYTSLTDAEKTDADKIFEEKSGIVFEQSIKKTMRDNLLCDIAKAIGLDSDYNYNWETIGCVMDWDQKSFDEAKSMAYTNFRDEFDKRFGSGYVEFVVKKQK